MSYLAPRPEQVEEQLHRLLWEKLAGDGDAVRKVEALIQALRAAQPAAWEPAPPERCENGRIPHC
ncbi:MAG: hypothetical protein M3220_17810 [Chloroflexota bacterium]|nr:hypothetical protein [Chloroflexota bacterium]